MDYTQHSATALARLISTGQASSSDIVSAHIELAKKTHSHLNAIVKDRYELAMQEARKADAAIKEGRESGPFHGVPCTIKECFSFKGMPNTSGLVSRKNLLSDVNAPAVERILNTGAIPLGVTNVSELCMWYESENKVYGRTNNPYNKARIVGGSSGGEGAIIGAGASPFGLGSDIGGSIRMPAFFNGVFGHKGSGGLIPNRGQFPEPEKPIRYLSTGPLCRKAEDLWPLVNLLAGPDGVDQSVLPIPLDAAKTPTLDYASLRVWNLQEIPWKPVSKELRQARDKTLDFFRKKGATVQELKINGIENAFDIWSSIMAKDSGKGAFTQLLGLRNGWEVAWHLFLSLLRVSPHTFPAIMLALTENTAFWFPKKMEKMIQLGQDIKAELESKLQENSLLVFPPHPRVAPRHYYPGIRPFSFVYTAILNIAEIPVTQVPLGIGESGLPVGIQIGAAHGKDDRTIAAALELEKAFGGWVPPKFK